MVIINIPISVSVSPMFQAYITEFNLSPTEIFRMGMAVALQQRGIKSYDNKLNKERAKAVKDFFSSEKLYNNLEAMDKLCESFKDLKRSLQ